MSEAAGLRKGLRRLLRSYESVVDRLGLCCMAHDDYLCAREDIATARKLLGMEEPVCITPKPAPLTRLELVADAERWSGVRV